MAKQKAGILEHQHEYFYKPKMMENGEIFLGCIYLYAVHWFLYIIFNDNYYFIFKRKKFEEERASFYKQQLLTPLWNQSLGGRKSKCKALYELWVLIVLLWHGRVFRFVIRLAVHLPSHHSVHLSVCSSGCLTVSVCLFQFVSSFDWEMAQYRESAVHLAAGSKGCLHISV